MTQEQFEKKYPNATKINIGIAELGERILGTMAIYDNRWLCQTWVDPENAFRFVPKKAAYYKIKFDRE